MKTIEYRSVDKSKWGEGPWQHEADKEQYADEATGLPCLIVRGPVGALCGYVGVRKGHPLYGIDYGQCPFGDACPDRKPEGEYHYCDHRPESALTVHGGITFSDFCHDDVSVEAWNKWRFQIEASRKEARKYPLGDAARRMREWDKELTNYKAWIAKCEATRICHVPAEGESDRVWWFGFDCAHAWDVVPKMIEVMKDIGGHRDPAEATYKDMNYVKQQVRELALQLHKER